MRYIAKPEVDNLSNPKFSTEEEAREYGYNHNPLTSEVHDALKDPEYVNLIDGLKLEIERTADIPALKRKLFKLYKTGKLDEAEFTDLNIYADDEQNLRR